MQLEDNIKLGFEDVLIRPRRSRITSRKEVNVERTIWAHGKTWTGVPLMAANMDTTGTFEMAVALSKHKMITCLHKHYTLEDWKNFVLDYSGSYEFMAVSTGIHDKDINKVRAIFKIARNIPFICIDVANGYSERLVETVVKLRKDYPTKIIMAGNVVTGEMTEALIRAGADLIKVGIGPGSVCTTRIKTGVGYPQLSAVSECAIVAHNNGAYVISDGGCTCPGDFAKAFGAGADFVMAGGIFAGHDESGGKIIQKDGKSYKLFYGMSSAHAMNKHNNGVAKYRASEGKVVHTPYKGVVEKTVLDLLGGIRSACAYIGATHIEEMYRKTIFVRTNKQCNNVYK